MKPLRLSIEGLYSYRERQEIDFEILCRGKLFGIFGPVGSGKSAILEAITLALYGDSERLHKRDNRNYNMLNLRSEKLYVEFEFLGGKSHSERYKFTYSSRRNSKNFADVRSPDRAAYRWEKEEWLPLESVDGAEVVGLSYENFRRTVIIPQGRFQEFLEMSGTDRAKMLKELFNLEKFDLYDATGRLVTRSREELIRIETELGEVGEVDAEKISAQQAGVTEREKQIAETDVFIAAQEQKEKEMEAAGRVRKEFEAAKQRLEELRAEQQDFDRRAEALEKVKQAKELFGEKLERHKEAKQEEARLSAQKAKLKAEREEADQRYKQAREEFDLAEKEYENREQWKEKEREMRRVVEVLTFLPELNKLEAHEKVAHATLEALTEQEKTLAEGLATREAELRTLRGEAPAQSRLKDLALYEERRSTLKQALDQAANELARALEAAQSASDAREALAGENDPEALQSFEAELQAAEKRLQDIRLHARLSEFASGLKAGEPCPLCGALDHPEPLRESPDENLLREAEARVQALRAQREKLSGNLIRLEALEKQLAERQAEVQRLREAQAVAKTACEAHQSDPQFGKLTPEAVQAELAKAGEAGDKLKEAETAAETARESLDRHRKDIAAAREQLAEIRNRLSALRTRKEEKLRDLRHSDFEALSRFALPELEAKADFLASRHEEAGTRYAALKAALREWEDKRNELDTRFKVLEREADLNAAELQKLREGLDEALRETALPDAEAAAALIASIPDLRSEGEEIETFRRKLSLAGDRLAALEQSLKVQPYESGAHTALKQELEAKKAQREKQVQEVAVLRSGLKDLEKRLKRREGLLKRQEAEEARKQHLGMLQSMFRGSGFVKFVSRVYLDELCRRANERFFRLTRNSLQLESDPEGEGILVRDYLNGGQLRHVKTLSGGQTFQASLSLALALSDSVRSAAGSAQNFFFLDEGFGSQDRESLQIVFETLKALRREDRIVGVISHVDELQQEIDPYLSISRDEQKGSVISPSWEL